MFTFLCLPSLLGPDRAPSIHTLRDPAVSWFPETASVSTNWFPIGAIQRRSHQAGDAYRPAENTLKTNGLRTAGCPGYALKATSSLQPGSMRQGCRSTAAASLCFIIQGLPAFCHSLWKDLQRPVTLPTWAGTRGPPAGLHVASVAGGLARRYFGPFPS